MWTLNFPVFSKLSLQPLSKHTTSYMKSPVLNLQSTIASVPRAIVILWKLSVGFMVLFAWYRILQEFARWLANGLDFGVFLNLYHGKRTRVDKNSDTMALLETRIEKLTQLNEELQREKEILENRLTLPSQVHQSTSIEGIPSNESKPEATTSLIAEFQDQKENNKMILNKLEHLESLYTLINNKDDMIKELELYNQAKSKVSNLENELMLANVKNSEMKEKLAQKEITWTLELKTSENKYKQLEAELEQSKQEFDTQSKHFENMQQSLNRLEKEINNLTAAVKSKTDEITAKNIEVNELKNKNDSLQTQLLNVSSDLDTARKDDTLRQKYEQTKSLLEITSQRLESLKTDYEKLCKDFSDSSEKNQCDQVKLQAELESSRHTNRELSLQYELAKNELKNSHDHTMEIKAHYELLKTQLNKTNEIIDNLNSKLNQAKEDLEHSNSKLDVMNSSLNETHENLNELKLNLNDEIHAAKLYRDENERLMAKINTMEANKRTWEKEINSLRLTLKKYRENEESEMIKHTALVQEMTHKIEEFKHEKMQLSYDIREMSRKCEELAREKEDLVKKYEEQQEKVLKQNDRALQDIQNEMRVKLDSAKERIVQKDDKLEQLEDLYKARDREVRAKYARREADLKRQLESLTLNNSEIILERARLANEKLRLQQEMREKTAATPLNVQILEQLKCQLEKRVDELEASNVELETKLASYKQGRYSDGEPARFSDQELTSGGEEVYPLSPRRSLCTPPASPRRGSVHAALSPQTTKLLSSLSSTRYMSLARDGSSPDLGIDSDHGRVSNSETSDNPDKSNLNKLIEENAQLQRMLFKTRQALENTIKQLAAANRRKCQIERDICKQLHKTQHIIRKARVNIQTSEAGGNEENVDPQANA